MSEEMERKAYFAVMRRCMVKWFGQTEKQAKAKVEQVRKAIVKDKLDIYFHQEAIYSAAGCLSIKNADGSEPWDAGGKSFTDEMHVEYNKMWEEEDERYCSVNDDDYPEPEPDP